jgi:uncharacterized LabA/DUF88 family protein
MRVCAYIDGFNLYHSIDGIGRHDLKWLDLRRLCEVFAPKPDHDLMSVNYFSAFATWRLEAFARHREFVHALEATGVNAVLGRFKEKDRECWKCRSAWKDHEEKETDVNIAIWLVRDAYEDRFDRALLISGDSDLSPAVRMVKVTFPHKEIRVIAPVGRPFSMDLVTVAGPTTEARRMKLIHLERSLFPAEIRNAAGVLVARRPTKYDPP